MGSWKQTCGIFCALCMLIPGLAQPALADTSAAVPENAVTLTLSDGAVLADGEPVPEADESAAVYTAHDIVYYEAGHDFTYGEGTAEDEHTAEEADAHTVVHIAEPGVYVLRGSLDRGQIAVDLGTDAADDPDAVVTLVLDGVDVTCTVAPAVIFYSVYECDPDGSSGSEPDLSAAGAQVVIADGSENSISGSYVARIYESCTLSEDGASVTDSKKLHKYDGAFYSKMSMHISGGPEGTGILNIEAANEGLDTEMHLTIDGGNIHIASGNDGINCNEDGVSVVTVNGGTLSIAAGRAGEGDGIDSNGWLVINSGTVTAQACSTSADSGLDGEKGIYLNGGMVTATGSMLDPLTPSDQCCAVFSFSARRTAGTEYSLTGADGTEYMVFTPENDFSFLIMTCPALTDGETYSLLVNGEALPVSAGTAGGMGGPAMGFGHGPAMPEGSGQAAPPETPDSQDAPEPPEAQDPAAQPQPPETPDSGPQQPSQDPDAPQDREQPADAGSTFTLLPGANYFQA